MSIYIMRIYLWKSYKIPVGNSYKTMTFKSVG